MALTRHLIDRFDGGKLAYYESPGDGPCLVLIPGSWGDYRVFDTLRANLPGDWRLIVVELPGHGASWPPAEDGSIERFADDVQQAVDEAGIQRFYVGGHSIGGMIAIEVAGRRPEKVSGAIPMEGWTHYSVQQNAFGGADATTLNEEQQRQRQESRARVRDKLTEAQIKVFAAIWRTWDGYEILETTKVPFLSIWGDRGRGPVKRSVLRIPDRANVEVVWITNASHSLLIERPEEVAAHMRRFIGAQE